MINHDPPKVPAGENPKFGRQRIKCSDGYANPGQCAYRHMGGGANVVFADDHARFIPGGQIVGGTDLPYEWPVINPNQHPAHQP